MTMGLAPVGAVAASCVLDLILVCGSAASIAAAIPPDGRAEHSPKHYLNCAEPHDPAADIPSSAGGGLAFV